jgi:hypothetical protein
LEHLTGCTREQDDQKMNMKKFIESLAGCVSVSLAVALVVVLGFGMPAHAALGGDVSSVEADRVHMNAEVNVTQNHGYDVHEIKAPGGTIVDEYVSPSNGRIFAVAWHGPFVPEMQQILGAYFQQFSAALQAQKKTYGRHVLNIQESGLVVQSAGHMRAYWGRAYVPEMLPQGITADEIK